MITNPPPLQHGDKIGIIAPAGYLADKEAYRTGCSIIKNMGFEIVGQEKNWPGYGYLADSDDRRVEELHRVWANPDIKAVFALRGGFGCLRIIDRLDLSLIRKNPKFLIGFSDITILHNYFFQETGLVSLHGPGLSSLPSADALTLDRLYQCLTGNWQRELQEDVEVVRTGPTVTGTLRGGNLSSLVTMIGTPWVPDLSETILFLEDINEPPYRLDRLLTQFTHSLMFEQVSGIILGDFSDDRDFDQIERLRRHEFVWNRIIELTSSQGMPVWGNFPAGHCRRNITLPIGSRVRMDSQKRTLEFDGNQHQD
jgi:muramoyltetrapeptide carboxypeptidase